MTLFQSCNKKAFALTFLALSLMFPTTSKAESPASGNGGIELIGLVAISTPFLTPLLPELFIEEKYEYSYWTSFSYGIASAIAMGVAADKISKQYTGEAFFSGLLIGNYLGYVASKHLKSDNLSLTVNINRRTQSISLAYRF